MICHPYRSIPYFCFAVERGMRQEVAVVCDIKLSSSQPSLSRARRALFHVSDSGVHPFHFTRVEDKLVPVQEDADRGLAGPIYRAGTLPP